MVDDKVFLTRVEEIAAEGPGYEHGHDGSDHLCDCIGLIIGAIRRAGGQWRGVHGTNYTARKEVQRIEEIHNSGSLRIGEVVFKSYDPGQGGYKLPARYEPGGEFYNGDLRDYYHIGVVISTAPLRIRYMTTPRPKMDTSLGKWRWHGWLKKISSGGEKPMKVSYKAKVIGGGLNLREQMSTSSTRITQIPDGATVQVLEELPEWCLVEYEGQTGYVLAKFLAEIQKEPDGEKISVDRAQLEKIYDTLGDWLGLRG